MTDPINASLDTDTGPRPLNWGILGAARIARKMIPAMRAAGCRPIAVGSRSLERAEAFGREFEIPYTLEGYSAVIEHPEVDAIYLPLANSEHFRWALACARVGKPCLCEKPLVLSAMEARELREAFTVAGVRLVEGFMWRHNPQTAWLLAQLRSGEIGALRRVHAEFSFALDRPDDYRWRDEHGGGALWDIGVYCVNAMRLAFGEEPECVSARMELVPGTRLVDAETVGWLDFGQGRLGTFHCSMTTPFQQRLLLSGSRGTIEVERPFIGVAPDPTRCRLINAEGIRDKDFPPSNSFRDLITHFRRAVHDDSFALTPAEDGLTQTVTMEALTLSAREGGSPRRLAEF